jgi:CO/xanthine dehydrogenase Mo-binding subunit
MTTTVKVHVNGKYRATVKQMPGDFVTVVEGNYNGGSGEKSFHLPHPASATFEITEEHVKDGDERPA